MSEQKKLTRRQRLQYQRFKEMGLFSENGKKNGLKLSQEKGPEYFRKLRAKRKNWRKGMEELDDNNA